MSKCKTSLGCKIVAWILCIAAITTVAITLPGVMDLASRGAYDGENQSAYLQNIYENVLTDQMNRLELLYQDQQNGAMVGDPADWTNGDDNIVFQIRDESGKLLASNGSVKSYAGKVSGTMQFESEGAEYITVYEAFDTREERYEYLQQLRREYTTVVPEYTYEGEDSNGMNGQYILSAECYNDSQYEVATFTVYLKEDYSLDTASGMSISQEKTQYQDRMTLLYLCLGGAALGVLMAVYLCWSAGWRKNGEAARLWAIDRILPLEVLVVLWALALFLLTEVTYEAYMVLHLPLYTILAEVLLSAALVFLTLSLVRQGKTKDLGKRALLHRLWRPLHRGGAKLGRGCKTLAGKLPLFWQALLLFLGLGLLEGFSIILIAKGSYFGVGLWFLLKAVEVAVLIYVVLSLRALQGGGKELAAGNLDYQIPLEKLRGPFRHHGEDLNNMRSAIQSAVEDQMKSQRMKTELITNVSHDIKTPLTSIVSYVDLLKKEELPQGKAQEYLDVLDRQSARLKKLTEDLVEASKASSGAIEVHCQPTDVNVLLSQSAGEYEEKLAKRSLTLVMTQTEANPTISADGRLLWRVLDNLLSNIVKYAMAGTRVYVTSACTEEAVTLTFRNISQDPLNISAQELTERFVRGDSSRTTEGSGLGLSIAMSLTQLQQGTFQVDIDGDLFKVTLTFPRTA